LKHRAISLTILFSLLFAFISHAQQSDFLFLKGLYLGQKPPGMTPEIFAPGIISMGYFERSVVFSPSQDELFFQFFCSFRPKPRPAGENGLTFMEVKELLDGPGNGRGDIYWVSEKIIDELRPIASPGRTTPQVIEAALTDVDGNNYKIIRIGNQLWMAENMRVTRDRAGNPLQSFCFDDREENCEKFGRLYRWDAALKAVPKGWHLPSDAEWKELVDYLGGSQITGKKLIAGGSSGFEALLAGGADYRGNYLYFGEYALFWSSTEVDEKWAYHQDVSRNGTSNHFAAKKDARVSVRCIKNN